MLIEKEEEDGKRGGEWSPAEFKVLEMVDWDITDRSILDVEHGVDNEDTLGAARQAP